jgi:hypothetical protein
MHIWLHILDHIPEVAEYKLVTACKTLTVYAMEAEEEIKLHACLASALNGYE